MKLCDSGRKVHNLVYLIYRWLSAILKRSLYSLKVSKVMEAKSMDKIKDEFDMVKYYIKFFIALHTRYIVVILKWLVFKEKQLQKYEQNRFKYLQNSVTGISSSKPNKIAISKGIVY